MSPLRILVGLLIAGVILAAEFVASWYYRIDAKWMLAVIAITGGILIHIQTSKALKPYWKRACTGIRWRRRFPNSPKAEIREFLNLFVDAFAFRRRRRCCFTPEDRVMDVYRAIYPPGSMFDSLELETFCMMLSKRYGIDFATSWRDDFTLGEIYEQTHATV